MVPFALLIAAHAADEACLACCRAGGLSTCEPSLEVYGDGSRLSRDVGAWRVSGVWHVGCDGRGVFVPSATASLDHPPLGGELIMDVVNPLQVHCFQQACGLPPGTCVSPPDEDGRFFLLECGTGLPADATALSKAPSADKYTSARVVVVDGRPLVVAPTDTSGRSSAAAAPTTAPVSSYSTPSASSGAATTGASAWSAPASPYSAPASSYSAPATIGPTTASSAPATIGPTTASSAPAPAGPTTSWSAPAPTAPTTAYSTPAPAAPTPAYSAPAPVPTTSWSAPVPTTSWSAPAPAAPTPTATVAPAPTADTFATFATSLPKDPPETCSPPIEALRAEARKRIALGDDKRMQKDDAGALQEYRAALSMDVCNAYGWLGIGEIASQAARPDLAVRALKNTTRILPTHYGAWTMLGRAYEALRQTQLAAEAYGEALALRPNLPEALEGWRRTAHP